jgi:hypothetical protein
MAQALGFLERGASGSTVRFLRYLQDMLCKKHHQFLKNYTFSTIYASARARKSNLLLVAARITVNHGVAPRVCARQ